MKDKRQQQILDILSDGSYASVEALSRKLYVSMPTVRRDLTALQEMGLVIRSHGGVVRRSESDARPLPFRTGVNAGEKLRLAHAAAHFLRDDCTIFIDESSTTLHLADCLTQRQNVTVVTNSMTVMLQLAQYKIPAYCLGGRLSTDTLSFYGSDTEEQARRFSIDLMFFSSSGLTENGWIVDYCEESNSLRRRVLAQSQTAIFLCDKSKYGRRAAHALMPISQADILVLNAPLPAGVEPGGAQVVLI